MSTEALFTLPKTWKPPKCPSTDEWKKEVWYIYTMEYYSATKKNEIMPSAATWMDLEMIILSEVRHGFEPWSGKIPHAAEQLSPCATTTEPVL